MEYKLNKAGREAIFVMNGRLTFADHATFRGILGQIEIKEFDTATFDLAGVDFIDSAGLGMLLLAKDTADTADIPIVLKGAQGQVKRLFQGQKFESVFVIED